MGYTGSASVVPGPTGPTGPTGLQGTGAGSLQFVPVTGSVNGTNNYTIALPSATLGANDVIVTLNGVVQNPITDYSIIASTLQLVGPTEAGMTYTVRPLSGTTGYTGSAGVDASSNFPVLIASTNTTTGAIGAGSFNTVVLNTVTTNTGGGAFNTTNGQWTVPETGIYDIQGKIRFSDGTASNAKFSWGIGIDTSNVDSPAFLWRTSPGALTVGTQVRHGEMNRRVMALTAGQLLRLFVYIDTQTGVTINAAELIAIRIR
jgi:hypothetical protein